MALPATDVFTGTDGTDLVVYSASWSYNRGATDDIEIRGNRVHADAADDVAARWNADTFPDQQYSQATIGLVSDGSGGGGVAVRVATGVTSNYYMYMFATDARLYTVIGGTFTQKGSTGTNASLNDTIRIEANGSTMTAKRNGFIDTTVGTSGTFTDSSLASGYAGIAGWGGGTTNTRLDNWEGGSLASVTLALAGRVVFDYE